ncbi:hypothetical protein [uncultured Roseobacter sp.]|uniref:hypothetical protein n=1 Tax=uncultured Roseobacter sp. TaxID=114847 RepID=UPI00261FA7E8|nr:hypothetical protein [uncultured Roseobacter sp.]
MAIISALIGGLGGFFSFAGALLVFKTSFLTAISLYVIVGLGISASLIAIGLAWRGLSGLSAQPAEIVAQSAHVPATSKSLLH